MALLARRLATTACALLLGGCDLSDLQDGQRGGGGSDPSGGAPAVGGAGGRGAGGLGGAGGACPGLGPFQWTRTIGNELPQFTLDSDSAVAGDEPSSIRVAANPADPDGGFYVVLTTDGALDFPELGGSLGAATRSLFVLRFDATNTLVAGRAHTQAAATPGQPPLLIDDAVVRTDGALVVSGRLGQDPLTLESMAGTLTEGSDIENPDAFVATFDKHAYATDLVRLESLKQSQMTGATVRGLTPAMGGVLAVGGYRQGLRLNGEENLALMDTPEADGHGFVMFLDGSDLSQAPVRVFRSDKQSDIALTSVTVGQATVFATADFNLNGAVGSLMLNDDPSWVLAGANYENESLIIAMDETLSPQWVTLVGSSSGTVLDFLESVSFDPATDTIWAVGRNDSTSDPPQVTTEIKRLFTLGPTTGGGCNTQFNTIGRAVVAAVDPEGACKSLETHAGFSAARASVAAHERVYFGGYGVPDSFLDSEVVSFDVSDKASGFVVSPTSVPNMDPAYAGLMFGGSRVVRVDDLAATPDGLIVVGSMEGGLLDTACPEADDYDFFVAKLPADR